MTDYEFKWLGDRFDRLSSVVGWNVTVVILCVGVNAWILARAVGDVHARVEAVSKKLDKITPPVTKEAP